VSYQHHEDEGQWEVDDEADDRRWDFTLDLEALGGAGAKRNAPETP
jgi:hypothetical protein